MFIFLIFNGMIAIIIILHYIIIISSVYRIWPKLTILTITPVPVLAEHLNTKAISHCSVNWGFVLIHTYKP